MKSSVPLYHLLKTEILNAIKDNTWLPGDAIPSEAEMAKQFDVSRITVRQAVGDLVSLGYLVRKQGKGTYVATRSTAFAASRLYGFAEELRHRGHQVDVEVQSVCVGACPDEIKPHLHLPVTESTLVITIQRIARINHAAVFRDMSYLLMPPGATPNEVEEHSQMYNYIYGFFEHYGVKIALGQQRISAQKANAEDMSVFGVSENDPMLVIRRVTQSETGVPVEFSEVRYPANLYEYEITLTREGV